MKGFLLDSHPLVWWAGDPGRLSPEAHDVIQPGRNRIVVSVASIWELDVKQASGRLKLPGDILEVIAAYHFETLPIFTEHARRAARLPPLHGDPFDRMLVAQAQVEGFTLVTRDQDILRYDVPTLTA